MEKARLQQCSGCAWDDLDPAFKNRLAPFWDRAIGTPKKRPGQRLARLENAEALAAVMHMLEPEAMARARATIQNLRQAAA